MVYAPKNTPQLSAGKACKVMLRKKETVQTKFLYQRKTWQEVYVSPAHTVTIRGSLWVIHHLKKHLEDLHKNKTTVS